MLTQLTFNIETPRKCYKAGPDRQQEWKVCVQVDITVNNILAIVNTKLLRDYAAVDDRLLQLVFVVKLWAKRRQVNDSYRGTLSSYCYVLMCIHLLQQRSPPVLPCLQAMQPTHTRYPSQSSSWGSYAPQHARHGVYGGYAYMGPVGSMHPNMHPSDSS